MSEEKMIKFKNGACIEFFGEDDSSSLVGFNSSVVHLDDLDDEKCFYKTKNDGE